jgi:SNF2 family DNA or RNA helicase
MLDGEFDLMGSGKYKQVRYMLQTILEEGKKVLIFSQYVRMLEILRRDLNEQGVKYCYIDGSTRDRQEQVEIFQKDESFPVFLISLKAGGTGLTLTAAEYVFILDPWWNPAAEMQAIDRAHRIGQTKTVMYYKFISVGTIEEKILALQQKKARLSDDLISADEDFFATLTQDEMVGLVK